MLVTHKFLDDPYSVEQQNSDGVIRPDYDFALLELHCSFECGV